MADRQATGPTLRERRVSYISGFATSGKITLDRAYSDIEALWQRLSESKKQLGVG